MCGKLRPPLVHPAGSIRTARQTPRGSPSGRRCTVLSSEWKTCLKAVFHVRLFRAQGEALENSTPPAVHAASRTRRITSHCLSTTPGLPGRGDSSSGMPARMPHCVRLACRRFGRYRLAWKNTSPYSRGRHIWPALDRRKAFRMRYRGFSSSGLLRTSLRRMPRCRTQMSFRCPQLTNRPSYTSRFYKGRGWYFVDGIH